MKGIKYIVFCTICALFMTCSEEEDKSFSNSDGPFVRFFMLVNNNNGVLEFPEFSGNLIPVSNYEKSDIKTLKIPVALTSEALSENVTVEFETTVSAGLENIEITPADAVTFTPERLVDTIFVSFTERWDASLNPELSFKLTQPSDPAINIGMPNDNAPNNELTIALGELNLTYAFESPNQKEILGTVGETADFSVVFPDGFTASEITGVNLIEEVSSDFDYSIQQLPLTGDYRVNYRITLNENIAIDALEFQTIFNLMELEGYTLSGSSTYTVKKPLVTDRDISINTASQFYDISDTNYRNFGVHWSDFNADGVCEWRDFNTFTVPVIVEANDPNAVLFDDMGTSNTDDDIYHHAFRIGFVSPISGNTTNPFNLKRFFNGESTSEANSPGFNIVQALEFFPENGSSDTNGVVRVIEQDLIISSTAGQSYIITISGDGTYSENAEGIFEIQLELNTFNEVLFGGNRTAQFRLYNSQDFTDPDLLTIDCFEPIDL